MHLIIKYTRPIYYALNDSTLLSSSPRGRFLSLVTITRRDCVPHFIILVLHVTLGLTMSHRVERISRSRSDLRVDSCLS